MSQDKSYSKLDQPPTFKLDDVVMDMFGNKIRYSHMQANGICLGTMLEGNRKGKTWYGIPQQLALYNDKVQHQLVTLTKEIELAEQNAQSLYSARHKLWQTVKHK